MQHESDLTTLSAARRAERLTAAISLVHGNYCLSEAERHRQITADYKKVMQKIQLRCFGFDLGAAQDVAEQRDNPNMVCRIALAAFGPNRLKVIFSKTFRAQQSRTAGLWASPVTQLCIQHCCAHLCAQDKCQGCQAIVKVRPQAAQMVSCSSLKNEVMTDAQANIKIFFSWVCTARVSGAASRDSLCVHVR